MLTLGLIREYTGQTYKKIAKIFKDTIIYKGIAKNCERFKDKCEKNKRIYQLFIKLKATCSQVET